MNRPLVAASLALLLGACGEPGKPVDPAPGGGAQTVPVVVGGSPIEGAPGARATVESYLVAAKVPSEAAMLALGTAEFQKRETTWRKAFTYNIVKTGFALKSYVIRDPELEGEKANVSVGAVFSDKGKDDRESMTFTLERRDGRWWITEIH